MRTFLMVAAVVAVAGCGKKQADTSAEQMGAAAGAAIDTMAHKADSTMGAMADSAHAAVGATVDSVKAKMEATPATPPKN
jgi:hypothetical protein